MTNTNTQMRKTDIDMSGLLQILGENLYSSPNVAIRELIQNAHDACHRRKIESNDDFDASISVYVKSPNKIIIEDNGSGLTHDEIIDFLATIGTGYTRKLRNDTASQNTNMQEQLVGYFGLGFLSAYVVAEKVEMITTSFQNPSETWCFVSRGGEQYLLEKSDNVESIGTRLILTLKKMHHELANLAVLENLIRHYCCLLPLSIYEKNSGRIINQIQPPWRLDEVTPFQLRQHQFEFAQLFEPNFEPICTIPISFDDTDGLLWIQDAGFYGTSDNRKVSVFIRNMFISSDLKALLPSWAGFVGCVINTQSLTPTASREDIQKNLDFDLLKQQIAEVLITGLLHIAENEPEHWRRILTRHNTSLLGASVSVPRFCDLCVSHNQVELGKTDSLTSIFTPVNNLDDDSIQQLKDWFEDDDEQLKVVSFEPDYIPLIYTEDQEILLKKRMESDEMDKKIGATALKLVRLHTNKIENKPARQVQINMKNSLINQLLDAKDNPKSHHAVVLLKSYMKALCIDPRGQLSLETLTQDFSQTINELIFK